MGITLFHGGTVLTMDDRRSEAEALSMRGERILAVGALEDVRAESLRHGESVESIDLKGRALLPGFNDDHIHLVGMGDYFSRPPLGGLSAEEIVAVLREFYRDAEPGAPLYGQGWDYPDCPNPHREILDRAFPDNPVALFQFSGHGAWVSSSMLKRLKIARSTPDPAGGRILRDSSGEPTGILLDAAARPIHRLRSDRMLRDEGVRESLLERSFALLRENGITSVQDNTWFPQTLRALRSLERRGRLTARVSCWSDGRSRYRRWVLDHARYDRSRPGGPGAMITRGPVKYFLDGTFSTRTAWLTAPYEGEPDNVGLAMGSTEWLGKLVSVMVRRRRQLAFHAIGDRAVQALVEALGATRKAPEIRMRIEHGQLIRGEDIGRIRDLGIVVSSQPTALATPEKDRKLLGLERALRAYPYRSLLDAGVPLAFGSDIPGESSFEPILAIHNTVNRDSPERITAAEALRCYTLGSAYAEKKEDEKGSLAPGKLADLVVLSENPLTVAPRRIKEIRVVTTIVGGKVVYQNG